MSYDPFVAQLADLCRREPTRAKWVIVPTHSVGLLLGDRLALAGVDWVNLRFTTPYALALEIAAPHLLARGLDPAPEGLGPSLVMQLLMKRPDGPRSYFRPLADQPRMGSALWAAIRELRLHGVAPSGLQAASFEDPRKHEELQALLAAYEDHLAARRQADAADVFRTAAAHATSDAPMAVDDVLLEAAELAGSPALVIAFLDTLPGRRLACAVPRVAGLEVPRRAAGRPRDPRPTESRLAWLLAPGEAPPPAEGQHVELFHAAGREAEVEAVLRRILNPSPAIPLDRVEIACAAGDAARLFWEKAQRLELPVTVEGGIPATATRPARALLGFCDWVDSGFTASRLRRLFQSGDVRIDFPDEAGGGRAARLLARSGATWGRDTYHQALAALAARDRASADGDDELDDEETKALHDKANQADFLAGWIGSVLALIPIPDDAATVALPEVVRGFSTLLDDHAASVGPLDAAAAVAIGDSLRGLLALDAFRCPVRQAVGFIRDAVERPTIGASRAKAGHLHLSTLASAGYAGRPVTFVVGLQEGGVFPSLVEDPVLLDGERRKISEGLPTSHDRLAEAVHAVVSRLAVLPVSPNRAEGSVCLSYSCRDLRDARETAPSWLMLQALRLEQRKPDLTYEQLRETLGTPETLVAPAADAALTDAGWWVASLKAAGRDAPGAVLNAFPSLAAGRAADKARASDEFTEWDGFVPAAAALLDPRVSGKPVSVTRLERLVECPFRYFVEHGLGLHVVDQEPGQDEWLDPLQKGAALHEIFAALCRQARAEGRRLTPRTDASTAPRLMDEKLAELRQACPPPSELVFDHERAELLRDVELFLEFEAARPESEAVAFEVGFGVEDDGEEPLARKEPVEIALGGSERFLLRGKIDRIDRLPDGSYQVIDYKTGKYDRAKWRGTFGKGAVLQHALYGVAAAALLRRIDARPRIAGGVYEFPSAKGGGARVVKEPPSRAALAAVLSDLFDVMAEGAFVSADTKDACRFCDFSRACGEPVGEGKAKRQNAANTKLAPVGRLESHD